MGAWLARLADCSATPLWLDDTAYVERLLAGGALPWRNAGALLAVRRRAHALLSPDIIVFDLRRIFAELALSPGRLSPDELDLHLSDDALITAIRADLQALSQSRLGPVALVAPSPRAWATRGQEVEARVAAIDAAAFALAAFLREFDAAGVAVLLLDECGLPPCDADEDDLCAPVCNVARHYRWDIGVRLSASTPITAHADFAIAPAGAAGVEIPPGFWQEDFAPPRPPRGSFWFSTIPLDITPERVLERRDLLRGP